jgi:hypothetical protein
MRLLVLVLPVLALAACKDKPKFVQPPDAGPECDGNTQLVNGVCRFVCQRDGDCMAGERCNLFLGQCEPKPPPPDAGPPPGNCTAGAVRCSGDKKAIETCQDDATWQTTTMCPPPTGFCQDERCLVCQPGAASCTDMTHVAICLDDGSGTRMVTCSGQATCQANECRECTPNSYRCSPTGNALQQCEKTGDETATWKWQNVGDNFDGTCITGMCQAGGANGFQCVPPACFPGQIQCKDASTAQSCGSTGAWADAPCPPGGECQAGVCVDECADAVAAKSYFGCDYWTAISDNTVDPLFKGGVSDGGQGAVSQLSEFAFVVTNRSVNPAVVTVTRVYGGVVQPVAVQTVPGRNDPSTKGLWTIKVPWQSIGSSYGNAESATGSKRYGYRIQSTKPLTVYQFSPLAAVKYTKACTATAGSYTCSCDESAGFNSLLCPLDPTTYGNLCQNAPGGGKKCTYFSFTNDASLLLPAHILGTTHVAVTQEQVVFAGNANGANVTDSLNGHLTIVGTVDNTVVTFKSSALTVAGGGVAALSKGQTQTFTLNSYDVLQIASNSLGNNNAIECAVNPFQTGGYSCRQDNDLSGTIITSTQPIAVFGGAACTLRPFDRVACDHVEEQLFPFNTWGTSFVGVKANPIKLANGSFATNSPPDHYKIVSGCPVNQCPNGTNITITPSNSVSAVLPPTTHCAAGSNLLTGTCKLLGIGVVEFKSSANFRIDSDQPIEVAWFTTGEGSQAGISTDPSEGDPSMILLPPIQQWRANYTVLAGTDFKSNYLGIAYDNNRVQSVQVDGAAISGFTGVPGTTFLVKNHPVSGGTHVIQVVPKSPQPLQPDGGAYTSVPGAGVTVYGYDSYVSYGYTGGLDLQSIVTGINPGG